MADPVRVALVVAVAENGVIGRDGDMPWRLSSDLKRFRALTMGKPMIMGRKTYQSIGRPLDGRDSVVVSRQPDFSDDGIHVADAFDVAMEIASRLAAERAAEEIMVIGGAQIYAAALPQADRIYMTRVHAEPAGDTWFPALANDQWREQSRERHAAGPRDDFDTSFVVLEREADERRS